MSEGHHGKNSDPWESHWVWGVVLIVLGCIFLAQNFGWFDEYLTIGRLWPLLLVFFGIYHIMKHSKG